MDQYQLMNECRMYACFHRFLAGPVQGESPSECTALGSRVIVCGAQVSRLLPYWTSHYCYCRIMNYSGTPQDPGFVQLTLTRRPFGAVPMQTIPVWLPNILPGCCVVNVKK